jgi:hypothetical protein
MRHPIRLLVVPASLAVLVVTVIGASSMTRPPSPVSGDSLAVASVVNEFHAALLRGDSAKALSLLAPDAIILESGSVESRFEYRSHHLPEDIKFAKLVASKRGILQVRVEGLNAWTVGTSTTKGTFNGRAIDSIGAESMVLTKQLSGWRIRSIHWSSRRRLGSS